MRLHEDNADYKWPFSCVYFFEAVGQGMTKIGLSTDPPKRFRQIQTSCPFELRAVLVRNGDRAFEKELHDAFAASRLHGEWFALEETILDEIAKARTKFWEVWHAFVRNVPSVRPAPPREWSFEEFEAVTQYEFEYGNPLERSLL